MESRAESSCVSQTERCKLRHALRQHAGVLKVHPQPKVQSRVMNPPKRSVTGAIVKMTPTIVIMTITKVIMTIHQTLCIFE